MLSPFGQIPSCSGDSLLTTQASVFDKTFNNYDNASYSNDSLVVNNCSYTSTSCRTLSFLCNSTNVNLTASSLPNFSTNILPFSQSNSNSNILNQSENFNFPFSSISNSDLVTVTTNDYDNGNTFDHEFIDPASVKNCFSYNNNFTVMNLNIRSLNANFNKLEILVNQLNFNPSIICVTETWLTQNKPVLYSLDNYNFINKPGCNKAGGTGLFVLKHFQYNLLNDLDLNISGCEDVWIELNLNQHKTVVVGSIYRHPTRNTNEFQEKLFFVLEKLQDKNKNYIICGDININLLRQNNFNKTFINRLACHGCIQTVVSPTHLSFRNKSSLLDHTYTNFPVYKCITKCIAYEISDHIPTIISIGSIKTKYTRDKIMVRHCKTFSEQQFTQDLNDNLNKINYNNSSGSDIWDQFEKTFSGILDKHAPLRQQTRKENKKRLKPYITKEILESIKQKQALYNFYLKFPTSINWNSFKKHRNKLTHNIKTSKCTYYRNKFMSNSSSSKKKWQTINEIINNKKLKQNNNIALYDDHDNIISDPKRVSNLFNKYFISIGKKLQQNIKKPNTTDSLAPIRSIGHSFFLAPFTESQLLTSIKQLNCNKATKSTCIPTKFVKISASVIAPVITKIFNTCITQGEFPKSLKQAEVIPVYKKGKKSELTNYRPISLLSIFSKLFEKHVHTEITKFITKHKILHKYQYGFRTNSSTELAVTQITEYLIQQTQNKLITCSLYLDLAKAFDTIDHTLLLAKLSKYGIRGAPNKLLFSYLDQRTQTTKINRTQSESEVVNCGVPQGSILGPLLFSLYINDLSDVTSLDVRLFADDACLTLSEKCSVALENKMNKELQIVDY